MLEACANLFVLGGISGKWSSDVTRRDVASLRAKRFWRRSLAS